MKIAPRLDPNSPEYERQRAQLLNVGADILGTMAVPGIGGAVAKPVIGAIGRQLGKAAGREATKDIAKVGTRADYVDPTRKISDIKRATPGQPAPQPSGTVPSSAAPSAPRPTGEPPASIHDQPVDWSKAAELVKQAEKGAVETGAATATSRAERMAKGYERYSPEALRAAQAEKEAAATAAQVERLAKELEKSKLPWYQRGSQIIEPPPAVTPTAPASRIPGQAPHKLGRRPQSSASTEPATTPASSTAAPETKSTLGSALKKAALGSLLPFESQELNQDFEQRVASLKTQLAEYKLQEAKPELRDIPPHHEYTPSPEVETAAARRYAKQKLIQMGVTDPKKLDAAMKKWEKGVRAAQKKQT